MSLKVKVANLLLGLMGIEKQEERWDSQEHDQLEMVLLLLLMVLLFLMMLFLMVKCWKERGN